MKSFLPMAIALLWLCFPVSSQITQLSAELVTYHTGAIGEYDLSEQTTFRVYADIPNPEHRLMSIIASPAPEGEIDLEEVFSYSACGTFDHPFGSWNAIQVLAQVISISPALTYDSWITPGVEPGFNCATVVYCTDPEAYDDEDVSMSNFTMHHGGLGHAAYCNVGFPEDGRVLVAQFTTCGTVDFYACFNVAVSADAGDQETQCLSISVTPGCTDALATNYSPLANLENGTCIYPIFGCIDPTACNYDTTAEADDGSCLLPGCLTEDACNYDPQAACHDDALCSFLSPVTLDGESSIDASSTTSYAINTVAYTEINWEVFGGTLVTVDPVFEAEIAWEYPGSGLVRVTVQTDDFCDYQVLELPVTVNATTSIETQFSDNFEVYPNPTEGLLKLSSGLEIEEVLIYDQTGRVLMQEVLQSTSATIDIGVYPSGIYLLVIRQGGLLHRRRVVRS